MATEIRKVNIFLDKTLPKRTRVLLQVLRVILMVLIFGSFILVSYYPQLQDVLVYVSLGLVAIFLAVKVVMEKRKKRVMIQQQKAEQN